MSNVLSRLVSTNQGTSPGAATSLVIAPASIYVNVLSISGYCYCTASTQYWLMFFPQSTVPSNGAQPAFKRTVNGISDFKFDYMPDGISSREMMSLDTAVPMPNEGGLIAVLSTTSETLTIATGSGNNMDMDVYIEEYQTLQTDITVVGNLTDSISSLQLWSESDGTHGNNNLQGALNLLNFIAVNNSFYDQYLQLFAQDDPVTNSQNPALDQTVYIPQHDNNGVPVPAIGVNAQLVPLTQWKLGPSAKLVADFGTPNSGIEPMSIDPGTTTIRKGCSLFVSTTSGYLTVPGSAEWNIQGEYK